MKSEPHQVTTLLKKWMEGDETALEQLLPLVHDELHRLTHQHMRREGPGHILQTSALINEAYVRLNSSMAAGEPWESVKATSDALEMREFKRGGESCRPARSKRSIGGDALPDYAPGNLKHEVTQWVIEI
jgi:hypothetical protein